MKPVFWIVLCGVLLMPARWSSASSHCEPPYTGVCAPLAQAQAAFETLESASFSIDIALEVADAALRQTVQFWAAADGVLFADGAAFDPPAADTAMWIETLITSLKLDMDVLLDLPEAAVWQLPLLPAGTSSLGLRLVDGIGYVDLSKVTATDGWLGIGLLPLYQQGWGTGLVEAAHLLLQGRAPAALLFQPPGTVTRLTDITFAGQKLAVFSTHASFASLLDDPQYRSQAVRLLVDLLEQQPGARGLENAVLLHTAEAYTELLRFISVRILHTISLESAHLYALEIEVIFSVDGDRRARGLELARWFDPLGAAALVLFDSRLLIELTLADFDRAPAVTAPADAQEIPPADLLPPLRPGAPL